MKREKGKKINITLKKNKYFKDQRQIVKVTTTVRRRARGCRVCYH